MRIRWFVVVMMGMLLFAGACGDDTSKTPGTPTDGDQECPDGQIMGDDGVCHLVGTDGDINTDGDKTDGDDPIDGDTDDEKPLEDGDTEDGDTTDGDDVDGDEELEDEAEDEEESDDPNQCYRDEDCADDHFCQLSAPPAFNICTQECFRDEDCLAAEECSPRHQCVPKGGDEDEETEIEDPTVYCPNGTNAECDNQIPGPLPYYCDSTGGTPFCRSDCQIATLECYPRGTSQTKFCCDPELHPCNSQGRCTGYTTACTYNNSTPEDLQASHGQCHNIPGWEQSHCKPADEFVSTSYCWTECQICTVGQTCDANGYCVNNKGQRVNTSCAKNADCPQGQACDTTIMVCRPAR